MIALSSSLMHLLMYRVKCNLLLLPKLFGCHSVVRGHRSPKCLSNQVVCEEMKRVTARNCCFAQMHWLLLEKVLKR